MKSNMIAVFAVCFQVSFLTALQVVQSARDIPVVKECDVLVVGGGSLAVAAAVAAKNNGASVILVAPRSYLGEDVAGTRELWPEVVEEFSTVWLAQQVFPLTTPFTYTVNVTPNGGHPDPGNTRLIDGIQNDAVTDSVQYDSDAQITLEFQGTGTLERLDVCYYQRLTASPFDTEITAVHYSLDGVSWSPATISVNVENLGVDINGITIFVAHVTLVGGAQAQYVRVFSDLADSAVRQLLDEIVIHTDTEDQIPGSYFVISPLLYKQNLQNILQEAEIPFMGSTPACDVLLDDNDNPAGVVLVNRKGRQAVKARVVIDCTDDAWLTQQAGGVKRAFTPGTYSFSRIVMADATNAPSATGLTVEMLSDVSFDGLSVTGVSAPAGMPSSINGRVYRCSLSTNLIDGSAMELLEVEQTLRDLTWVKTCVDQADTMTWMPPDSIVSDSSESATAWTNAAALDIGAFRPAGVTNFFVTGLRADVTRSLAAEMRNPARMMAIGERIGAVAAIEALTRTPLTGVSLPGDPGLSVTSEDVHELLAGLPPVNTNAQGVVAENTSSVPILATCEVLVIGAGTAGAPAAISAGRAGADTLVVEFLYNMGGVQTDGRIGRYYHGNICGFTVDDVDPGVNATGSVLATSKSEWYRQACREAGVRILYGTMAAGALVDGTEMKGVVVVLPDGRRGVIQAEAVIDATGNALVAAAAGVETTFIKTDEVAVQGAGQARHLLGDSYSNSDVGFVDDRDVADLFFFARRAYASMSAVSTWDAGQNPASRERRRLVGVVTVDPVDILNDRTWPDTIVCPRSNFDSHGFTVHDLFFIRDPGTADETANLPYRALLPKTLDGLLVTGLGISAHRDAMPILRMQPDVQNQGYAAGYAAALAVQNGVTLRNVDMAALQDHLIVKGILEPSDKGTPDSFPLGSPAIQAAVDGLTNNYATLHTVLSDVDAALPMLRTAYAAQSDPGLQLIYAHVLGLLYDPMGVDTLASAVSAGGWDTGWNYRGMGQYGLSVSQMDSYIIALGRTQAPAGISPVLAKTALLTGSSSFSHIRSVSFALQNLDGGSSISAMSGLLGEVKGYAFTNSLVAPVIPGYSNTAGDTERNNCLKEISVARALFKLGDDVHESGARVLSDYALDPREVYASHARLVLQNGSTMQISDGIWIGTESFADWNNTENWYGGQIASGMGATAFFTNSITGVQTISLNSGVINIGSLIFSGGDRIITDGILDISSEPPLVAVAADTQVSMEVEVLSGSALIKSGDGTLDMAGTMTLSGLDLTEGRVVLSDPEAQFYRAYAANTNDSNRSSVSPLSLRCDFRVNEALMITELGAYDSNGDGFENFKKVSIYNLGGGVPLQALAFSSSEEEYPFQSGYRFRKISEPLVLQPGDYSIVTYGFSGADQYVIANQGGVGEQVGPLVNGDGALTFLTNAFSSVGGAVSYPTTAIGPASDYAVSAGSFRFATGAHMKTVSGPVTVAVNTMLDVAAVKMIFDQGLTAGTGGMGVVSNASAAHAVSLTLGVADVTTNTLAANAIGHREDGPLNLVKKGDGVLVLNGSLSFEGGLHVGSGPIAVDSPEALTGGDLSFGTGGRLRLLSGGSLDCTLYVANQSYANDHSTGLELAGGETLTLIGGFQVPRIHEYGGFVIQPFDEGAGLTSVVMNGVLFGYFDLYLLGDGPGGTGAAEHLWTGVRGGLRKLSSGNETTTGSRIIFGTGCDFSTSWFDVSGSNAVITITNNANIRVASQLRFVDGNDSQLSLDGGTLVVRSFGVANINNNHLSLKPVLLNGTWIHALADNDYFFDLSMSSAAPLICDGGALFNTESYEVAIRGKGFAQAPGSTGVFVKDGSGTLKIAAPMSYTGLTVVSNGVLSLDFGLWQGTGDFAQNLLPPSNSVWCANGAGLRVAGITNAAGEVTQRQRLARVESAAGASVSIDVAQAGLEVNALDGSYVKTGDGTLTVISGSEGPSRIHGTLNVQQGVLELLSRPESLILDIPYPSFESDPLLPVDPINSKDKRGTAAIGCPGWTFVSNDAGYQRNASYFSGTAACYAPDGVQTAFVRRNGSMNTTLEILTNGIYSLTFQYCPRYFDSVWYANHILHVNLDGDEKDAVTVTDQYYNERTVMLGELAPGNHTLSIAGDSSLATDPITLIDRVSVTGTTGFLRAESLSNKNWHLSVDAQGQIALNYSGLVTLGSLTVNGVAYSGVYVDATTHPDFVTGSGTLRINQSGLIFILR
ncbi:MAG: FAD-dependent oxidoreductase [Kiritimatiellae bacterium]|jgi:autotransporter-associated beta strand protein|nr:FAD-dependent oxidoreductase [Kiritimatiellia bacterium]